MKLDNILIDDNLNIKVADFGFSTYTDIHKINIKVGTESYMAPEIQEGKVFHGHQTDIFSLGVVIFSIVHGIFPFQQATKDDPYYKLFCNGEFEAYWSKLNGENLSSDFKNLMELILNRNPKLRPTLDELRKHPWMQQEI